MTTDSDLELHKAAVLFRLTARTPEEEAYFRGYESGVSKRIAIGTGQAAGTEAIPVEPGQDATDGISRALGAGYRDGLAGAPLRRRKQA